MKHKFAAGLAVLLSFSLFLSVAAGLSPVRAEEDKPAAQALASVADGAPPDPAGEEISQAPAEVPSDDAKEKPTAGELSESSGEENSSKNPDTGITGEPAVSSGEENTLENPDTGKGETPSKSTGPEDTLEYQDNEAAGDPAKNSGVENTDGSAAPNVTLSSSAGSAETEASLEDTLKSLEFAQKPAAAAADTATQFTVSGGTITGFQQSYLDSLPEENGLKYTDLVIPDEINGTFVTEIGYQAFLGNKYEKVRVRRLDLSQAKHLKTIGAQAFYAYGSLYSEMEVCTLTFPDGLESVGETAFTFQSALTGSLTFPDSVGTIGNNSFRGCGFNGALKLPENSSFQKLGSQVFMECHFTGTLRIPESVTEIADFHTFEGNQFSEVILSSRITGIGGSAFQDCGQLQKVRVAGKEETSAAIQLPDALTSLGGFVFQNCTQLSGWVKIPDLTANLGAQIFQDSGIHTIYLPDNGNVTYSDNFLLGAKLNAAVFPSKERYDADLTKLVKSTRTYCGYPVTVAFLDAEEQTLTTRDVLFNRPVHYDQTENGWEPDPSFSFPAYGEEKTGYDVGWSFTKGGKVITPASVVTGNTLYYSCSLSAPTITFEEAPTKDYDGKTEYIRCTASHPLAGDDGPYTFLYCTLKDNGGFFYVSDDPFVYPVKDVSDSGMYVCYVQMYDKAHPEYRGKWSMSAWYDYFATYLTIRKANPVCTPVFQEKALIGTPLSELNLTLSPGSTPGTLIWETPYAVLADGEQTVAYTYTPADTENYKVDPITGTAVVTGVAGYRLQTETEGPGAITPDQNYLPADGQTLTFTPAYGYQLKSVSLNGVDVTSKLRPAEEIICSYLDLKASEDVTVHAVFEPISASDVTDLAGTLPDSVQTSQDARNILHTKLQYEALNEEEQKTISEETKKTLANALLQLPAVEVRTEVTEGVSAPLSAGQEAYLLTGMTAAEAQDLMDGSSERYVVKLIASAKEQVGDDELAALTPALNQYQIGSHFDVSIQKEIYLRADDTEPAVKKTVNELEIPLELVLTIPESLMPPETIQRSFAVLRTHLSEGALTTTFLEDFDHSETSVTIRSDRFSTYTLIYLDSEKESEPTSATGTEPTSESTAPATTDQTPAPSTSDEPTSQTEESTANPDEIAPTLPPETKESSDPASSTGEKERKPTTSETERKGAKTGDTALSLPALSAVFAVSLGVVLVLVFLRRKHGNPSGNNESEK